MGRGAVWMVMFKFVERGLGLISTLILARLLAPEDFGMVAMAMSFIAMAELLGAFGFDVALIQNSAATREHYDSAWTCGLVLGVTITLLMVVSAWPIAQFYRRPELFWVVFALAFGPFLGCMENIGVVAFRKELDFRREFRYQVSRKLVSFAVVVPLAFILRSYWALVVGILLGKVGGTVISYLMHPFRPRPSLAMFWQLFRFSRWLLINNFVSFLKERSSDFFLGRLSGASSLGIYNVAYELSNLPTTEISAPINRALLPGFAKMDSPDMVAGAYVNAVGLLALVALPAAACMFVVAPFLVPTLLGSKWLGATPLIQVLAFNGALLLFQSSMCSELFARGHPATVTSSNAIFSVVLITLLATVFWLWRDIGVVGAAYAALATSLITTPLYLFQMWRCLQVPPSLFGLALRRPLLGCVAMVTVVYGLLPTYDAALGYWLTVGWLLAGGVLAIATYLVVVALAWHAAGRPPGAERIAYDFVRALIVRRFEERRAARRGNDPDSRGDT